MQANTRRNTVIPLRFDPVTSSPTTKPVKYKEVARMPLRPQSPEILSFEELELLRSALEPPMSVTPTSSSKVRSKRIIRDENDDEKPYTRTPPKKLIELVDSSEGMEHEFYIDNIDEADLAEVFEFNSDNDVSMDKENKHEKTLSPERINTTPKVKSRQRAGVSSFTPAQDAMIWEENSS